MRVRISMPAAALAERRSSGTVLGGGPGAIYVALDTDVVAVTDPSIVEMPVGIELPEPPPELAAGTEVALSPSGLTWPGGRLGWSVGETYDPTIREVGVVPWIEERARHLADLVPTLQVDGTGALRRAVDTLDRSAAREAAELLTGRGGGLTPEGDDLLSAVAGSARAAGWSPEWIRTLLVPDIARRTTSLSGSLLRHAVEGRVIAPLRDLWEPDADWRSAAGRLAGLGHSTGPAYLNGAALVMAAVAGTD